MRSSRRTLFTQYPIQTTQAVPYSHLGRPLSVRTFQPLYAKLFCDNLLFIAPFLLRTVRAVCKFMLGIQLEDFLFHSFYSALSRVMQFTVERE